MQKPPVKQLSKEALDNARKAFLKDVCKMAYIDINEHPLIYNRIDNNTSAVAPQLYKQFFDCIESEFSKSRENGFALTGVHLVRAAGKELRRRIMAKGINAEVEKRAVELEQKLDGICDLVSKESRGRGLDEKRTFTERHLGGYRFFSRDDIGNQVIDDTHQPETLPMFDKIELLTCAAVGADPRTHENRPFEEVRALIWQHLHSQQGRGKFRQEIRHILKRILSGSGDTPEAIFLRKYNDGDWNAEATSVPAIEDAKVRGMIHGVTQGGVK